MEAAADYWFSRQPDYAFRIFAGNRNPAPIESSCFSTCQYFPAHGRFAAADLARAEDRDGSQIIEKIASFGFDTNYTSPNILIMAQHISVDLQPNLYFLILFIKPLCLFLNHGFHHRMNTFRQLQKSIPSN